MSEFAREVVRVNIEDEMRQSYLDYAMSVIVGRALPDVRDGLKPVHRRVLHAMRELGNDYNKAYKKSARVVGDVIGKYHPHGDSAVYDTMVRMAQPFSMRYVLIDGQGNFGSVDGDSPAAMRYTEVRMTKLAHEMLADIDRETVDFIPNYDGSEQEPAILPTRVPNLLINGAEGIAVGMATKIPPHNLREIVTACIALLDHPELTIPDLIQHVPAPDFPTGGTIFGINGIHQAYLTGRGRVVIRAKSHVEGEAGEKQSLVFDELPYQVNKALLLERIADLVREKKIEGISGLRDESDKDGMRMVVELKRGEIPDVVLNNLYRQTALQSVFGVNMVALIDGRPRLLNLKEILDAFLRHRREVVTRRTLFDLRKARERAHLLEGLAVALANLDPVIELIKKSPTPAEAKEALISAVWQPGMVLEMVARAGAAETRPEGLDAAYGLQDDGYRLSPEQAQAILDLRLNRLTGLEQEKILNEFREIVERIAELLLVLTDPERLRTVVREELNAVREQYGDDRRTDIVEDDADIQYEDLIAEEDMVVTLSHGGYVKRQPLSEYRAQRRGGRGKSATSMKEEDFIDRLIVANTHDTVLCFSTRGRLYWIKVYMLPQAGRNARGRPINNILPLEENERISAFLPIREYTEGHYVLMATESGTVKKTALTEFSRPRSNGIIAVNLRDDDRLIGVEITDGGQDVMLFSSNGRAVRFAETEVRAMGRTSTGVIGMRIPEGERIVSLLIPEQETTILTATENGYGKRTAIGEYPRKGRGIQGVISIQTSERNGPVVGATQVAESDEIMLITDRGTLVRTQANGVSQLSRNTQGVTLIRLTDGERLVSVERVAEQDEDGLEGDAPAEAVNAETEAE
jgi:DNA gyrase subunit A